ncbi:hypothetical protein TUM4261_23840 [Shewanella sp. c952]|nr:hypothetical protein TUM4261_23840 [Shewanella sp. c952]
MRLLLIYDAHKVEAQSNIKLVRLTKKIDVESNQSNLVNIKPEFVHDC